MALVRNNPNKGPLTLSHDREYYIAY